MNLLPKLRITTFAGAALLLAGCTAPSSYMGISLQHSSTSLELRELALRAKSGDKQAQLDLGSHFENGIIVSKDWSKAEVLYRSAANNTPITRTHFIHSGQSVVPETVNIGYREGLAAAKVRLDNLLARQKREMGN
ncbi:MAG: hypothetical protein ACK4SJ_06215 [Sphingorhabdus sp.]